jgi:nucleoside-diphosphate-sugar epimerase
VTLPAGGTSDYASEMIHAAAQGHDYACFVGQRARIPFMAMPDGVKALVQLASAPAERLRQRVYNVTAFSISAGEIRQRVLRAFPAAKINFEPDPPREAIVNSWPTDVDAFNEYLVPTITRYYKP